MKNIFISLLISLSVSLKTNAAEPLVDELKSLDFSEGQAPQAIQNENYYSVQERMYPLTKKIEFSVSGAQEVGGGGFLNTNQVSGGLMYHFNDKWSVGVSYSQVYNDFTDAAEQVTKKDVYPDITYTKNRTEYSAYYNLFYGKFRFSRDQVYYFDQYIGLGYTQSEMRLEKTTGFVADIGMAFWVPPYGGLKIGLKDYNQKEKTLTASSQQDHMNVYMGYSYLF